MITNAMSRRDCHPEQVYNQLNPGKKPSQNELSGENPSGENPSKVSCGENPSPYFGTCGEKPSHYFHACGENPLIL